LLDTSVVSEVENLLASAQPYGRIASTLGVSRNSVRKIAKGVHTSQLPRKHRERASVRCPVCGAVETEKIDLHGEEQIRYRAVRAEVERQFALGLRTALTAPDERRSTVDSRSTG
jgi:ribosomal protein S14